MREEELVLQPFPDVRLPARCLIGMTEERTLLDGLEFGRNGYGTEIPLPQAFGAKYETKLANNGQFVRLPSRSIIPGLVLTFDSTLEEVELFDPGTQRFEAESHRDIVPGSVSIQSLRGRYIRPEVNGRTIVGADVPVGLDDIVEMRWRLRLVKIVVDVSGLRSDWTGSHQGFVVTLREVNAP